MYGIQWNSLFKTPMRQKKVSRCPFSGVKLHGKGRLPLLERCGDSRERGSTLIIAHLSFLFVSKSRKICVNDSMCVCTADGTTDCLNSCQLLQTRLWIY